AIQTANARVYSEFAWQTKTAPVAPVRSAPSRDSCRSKELRCRRRCAAGQLQTHSETASPARNRALRLPVLRPDQAKHAKDRSRVCRTRFHLSCPIEW